MYSLRRISLIFFLPLLFSAATRMNAATASILSPATTTAEDTLQVSLLTCDPGPKTYELYGHTSIRVRTASGADWAFNYGMFDFRSSGFVWRFVLGHTDYFMAAYPFSDFLSEYQQRGSAVTEQVLNLTKSEKEKLFASLCRTACLEDWTYRYNFLYDNCTSRAVGEIERAIDGNVVYPKENEDESYRQIIHRFTKGNPWTQFGQDLLLGRDADVPIADRQKMFSPIYTKRFFAGAKIADKSGKNRALVKSTLNYSPTQPIEETAGFPIGPIVVFGMVLVITIFMCMYEIMRGAVCLGFDAALMAVEGLAGCIIATLFFFSEHPTVGSNWLIMILNPLPLIFIFPRILLARRGRADYYPVVALAVITVFFVFSAFIGQRISLPVYLFAISLWLQSAAATYIQYKAKWKNA